MKSTQPLTEQEEFLIALGLHIVNLRRKKRMSRAKLAKLSQLNTQYILDIESGRNHVGIFPLAKIALAFEIPVSKLLINCNLKPIE